MESTDPAVADTVLQAVAEALRDVTGRIVIGYSGGLDSTVLLWAVSRILPAERILAAHVNHNAQAASSAWVHHCREFSEGLRIAFLAHDLRLSGRGNFEALARDQRHAWLRSLLQAHDVLLLAHHQDDQAETALLRILQGRGTYGMPMARTAGAGELRRPLLRIPHRTLVEVALREGLRWVHDPTNDEPSRDRAFVRGRVLALLRTRWPEVSRDLAAIGERSLAMEGAGRFMAGQLPDPLPLSRLPEDASAAIEIIRWWILVRGGGQPGRGVLERWYADGAQRAARRTFVPLSKGRLIAEGGLLYFQPTPGPSPAGVMLPVPGRVDLGYGVLECAGPAQAAGLEVRFAQGSAAIDVNGRRRTARAVLQKAVLAWERGRFPLLFLRGELVCVPGLAQADSVQHLSIRFSPRLPMFSPGFAPAPVPALAPAFG